MSSTAGTPSISQYSQATKVAPELTTPEGSLAMLHEIAWVRQNLNEIFHKHFVKRDDEARVDSRTPDNVLKLTWGDPSTPPELLTAFFDLSAILVRDEYRNMLRDLIKFAYQTEQCADEDMEIDKDDEQCPDGNMEIDKDGPPAVVNPFNTEALPIALGATVLGNPGIGKSVFLIFVLALRLLCRRTTVFQQTKEGYYVLNNEGVFYVRSPVHINVRGYLPTGTWFLIDSNENLADVPMEVPMLASVCRGFILQAASPRTGRVQWQKKRSRIVNKFWMKSWSIAELIAGRDLQWPPPMKMYTEVAIKSFCELYGTSARHVYASAMDPARHAEEVDENISDLTREKVIGLLRKAAAANIDDAISHYIIEIKPIPGARKQFTVKITTKYLVDQILIHLSESDKHAASNLYRAFIKVPHTRAGAGYILERTFLEEFPNGGEWPITAMKRGRTGDNNIHWHSDASAPLKFLRLGFQPPAVQGNGKQGPVVLIEDDPLDPSGGSYGQVEQRYFSSKETLTLERRFYIPQSSSQPSFDAFVYDPDQRRATMFQVTVAKKHDISILGLDWLNECGATTIDLVMVIPPLGKDEKLRIGVADSHGAKLDNVYCLVLD